MLKVFRSSTYKLIQYDKKAEKIGTVYSGKGKALDNLTAAFQRLKGA